MTNMYSRRAPHQGDPSRSHSPNAALLIDFDNVTMAIRSDLGKELKALLRSDVIRGKVAVQRAYADWRRYPQYIVPLSEASVDLIFAPAYGTTKKNATDIRLAIDALELIFTRPEIGTFILLSGDSDFSSLVLKLKEYGKYVIGVGMRESSSDLLVQNCDEYYSYSSLAGLTRAGEEVVEAVNEDPFELVARAVKRMTERRDVMRSDRLKQVLLELNPSFDEREIGWAWPERFGLVPLDAPAATLRPPDVVEDCVSELAPNVSDMSVRNMSCTEADDFAIAVIRDLPPGTFERAGFSCQILGRYGPPDGPILGAENIRCAQGDRAFRFSWGD
jgi:uncharacterized protein (TIGR00288 family)